MIGEPISLGLLVIIFVSIMMLAFVVSEYDVLHPFTILSSVMTFSAVLTWLAPIEWQVSVSFFGLLVVMTAIFSFGVGCFFSDWCVRRKLSINNQAKQKNKRIPNFVLGVACVVLLYFSWMNFTEVYEASLALGNNEGYSGMLATVRRAVEENEYQFSRGYAYRGHIAQAFVYYSVCVFFLRCFFDSTVSFLGNVKYLLPILFYFPMLILSGARLDLFCLIIFIVVMGGISYQKKYDFNLMSKKRSLLFVLGGGTAFCVLFLLFGFFTGKVTLDGRSPFAVIAHYGGLSMPALSVYLESTFLEVPYVGTTTLFEFYRKSIVLGMDASKLPENMFHFLTFVQFNGIDTNVYTGMRRYIQDYGFFGMYLIMAIWGIIYTAMYNYVRFYAGNLVWIAIYASMVWPLVWMMNDEGVFTGIVQSKTLYFIAMVFLIDWIFGKRGNREL